MAFYWQTTTVSSGTQTAMTTDEQQANMFTPLAAPATWERTLLWWEARWHNHIIPGGGPVLPNPWRFTVLAVENDTGEPPPGGPPDPVMNGMMSPTVSGPITLPVDESTDLFNSWVGFSGGQPMDSHGSRAAVNYSGGLLPQVRFQALFDLTSPEGLWGVDFWIVTFRVSILIRDPSI